VRSFIVIIANSLLTLPVKELRKSANILRSFDKHSVDPILLFVPLCSPQ